MSEKHEVEYREIPEDEVLHYHGMPVHIRDGKVGTHPGNWRVIEEAKYTPSEPSETLPL